MKIRASFRALAQTVTNFFGRGFSGVSWFLSGLGSAIDYSKEAGARYDNSAVAAAVQWMQRRMSEVTVTVQKRKADNTFKQVDHEFASVLENGPCYPGTVLLWGTILALVVSGNAYWYKVRSKSGKVVGYAMLDYTRTRPMSDKYRDASNEWSPATYFEFRNPDGQVFDLAPMDVVHFRFGIDPADHKRGISPIQAALREIVTDNEAALLGVSLLKNGGMPALAFEPAEGLENITPDQSELIQRKVKEKVTGPSAGSLLMMGIPGKFTTIGHSPDKLVLNQTRAMAVSRILSGLGIDPMVLGFPSENKTYSNYGEANEAAVENCFLPLLALLESTLTAQTLIPDFEIGPRTNLVVKFDTSQVRALQPDLDKIWERVGKAFERDLVKRGEARESLGFSRESGDDVYYSDVKAANAPLPTDPVKKFKRDVMERVANVRD